MNKQLQELAKQADGVFIHKLMTGAKQYTFLEKDLEKFAELIVRECIQVLKDTGYPNAHGNCVGVGELEQHFGVDK